MRRGLLTQYQLERLMNGYRTGFFYGDYKVLYCVGAGTFARVYRATHKQTGKMYAVKVLRSRYSNPKATDAKTGKSNKPFIELFRREGEIGIKLKHPNIVEIHEIYSHGLTHYIVMDFIEGQNLREFYRARRRFDPLEAAHIMEGVMAGLNYALQQGITHRDLKMSNVLLSSDGEPKLVDFGLAGVQGEVEDEAIEGISRRTVDYAGLERATRRSQGRSPHRHLFLRLHLLSNAHRPAGAGRIARPGAGRQGPLHARHQADSDAGAEAAAAAGDGRQQGAGIRSREALPDAVRHAGRPEAGDQAREDRRRRRQVAGAELESSEGHDASGQPRKLMIVESDVKMQDMLRELFKRNGYRVLVSSDPNRVLSRFFDDSQAADLILFTTSNNGRTALEVFNRFGQESQTRDMPAVLLLDQIHGDWAEEATVADHRVVAKMPIKMRELRELLVEVGAKKVS